MNYEYKVEPLSSDSQRQESELNELAEERWELVSVTAAYDSEEDYINYRAFLRRPK